MIKQLNFCEICDKDAMFICGDCRKAKYCTTEHRSEHWRIHKQQCKVIKQVKIMKEQEQMLRSRSEIRKRYFEHFNHKIYDKCIEIAKQLFWLQKQNIQNTRDIFNEFQYGIAVCLLCRIYILVNRKLEARQEIDNYIKEKLHFLQDLRNIPTLKDIPEYTLKAKMFLQKKLTLISAVANIYYELNLNCLQYYQIYTHHIELVFGSESLQLSNAYFCIGTYYKEINQITKAIACFVKAASIRGKKGGDCYVNISLLYRMQDRIYAAIDMMLTAIKLNEQQYGNNSRQVGQVYQKLGLLYLDIQDFNNSILNLENALKIYINQKESDDYQRIRNKIQILYNKLKKFNEQNQKQKKYKKKEEEEVHAEQSKRQEFNTNKSFQLEKLFKVSDSLLNKLNPMELFRLSNLQLQLEECRSEFALAHRVRNSQFFKELSDNRKKELRIQNEKLFTLINIELKLKPEAQQLL